MHEIFERNRRFNLDRFLFSALIMILVDICAFQNWSEIIIECEEVMELASTVEIRFSWKGA